MLTFNGFVDEEKLYDNPLLTTTCLKLEFEENDLDGDLYFKVLSKLKKDYELEEIRHETICKFIITMYIGPPIGSDAFRIVCMLNYQVDLIMGKYNQLMQLLKEEIGKEMSQYVSYHKD